MTSGDPTASPVPLLAALTPRRPGAAPAALPELLATARAAERAGFAAALLYDAPADHPGRFEAGTLAAALAAATDTLGLLMCTPPLRPAPYHLARITASLDHLSHGRAGWCVTPAGDPFGADSGGDSEERASLTEYLAVVRGLWDSFDDDAFVHDRAEGTYWHLDRVHRLDHSGPHHTVAGPLNVARPPQGHPPIAVTDPDLAAHADLLLLDAPDPATAARLRTRAHAAAAAAGRPADALTVIAALPTGADAALVARWQAAGAGDGFLLRLSGAEDPFLAQAVPELRRRGLLAPPAAPGTPLRARLGLPRPARGTAVPAPA